MLERIDPLGRRTSYTYAANGVDLLEVRPTTGTANDLLAAHANCTASHQPQSVPDYTYDAYVRPRTVTWDGVTMTTDEAISDTRCLQIYRSN